MCNPLLLRSALNIWHINITTTVNFTTSIVRLIYQMDTLIPAWQQKRDTVQYGTKAITVTPFRYHSVKKPLKYRLTESKVNHENHYGNI